MWRPCERMRLGSWRSREIAAWKTKRCKNSSARNATCSSSRFAHPLECFSSSSPLSLRSLQYELTVKRNEMRKLEEIIGEEEARIEKAEKNLEEDAVGASLR